MLRKTFFISLVTLLFLAIPHPALADMSAQLKQAQTYQNNRQYEQAEAIYQQIITAFPDTNDALEAQKQLTLTYIAAGTQQQADAAFEKLVANFSKHKGIAEAVWQIGQRYIELKKYDKAFELNQYNVEHFPNDMYAMWSQVEIVYSHIRDGNEPAADVAFDKLVTAFSNQPTLPKEVWQIGQRYIELKKYDKAFELNQYNVKHFSNDMYAMWSQVEIVYSYIRDGNDAAADAAFNTLLAAFSGQPTLPKEIYQVARKYDELKKYDKAIVLHQYNVDHFPTDIHAIWSQVEIIYSRLRDGNELAADAAVSNLLTVFSKQPTLSQEIYQVARKYDELKKYDKAIALHQYNVDHFPADIHAIWSQVETVYSYIRDANETAADAAFKKLLAVFSGQPTLPNEIQQIADAYNRAGKYDKANQLYQKTGQIYQSVIDKKPDSNDELWAKVGIAKLNISVGDDAAVQADVNNLIADFNSQPALPQAIFAIGEEYYNKALNYKSGANLPHAGPEEYYQKAMIVWERIIKELPDTNSAIAAHTYYFSAVCYRKLGKYEKAVEYFQKVVIDWPNYQYAWSAQCLIGECYEKLRNSGAISKAEAEPKIEQAYQAVIEKYPDCSLVGNACLKLGDMYLQRGDRDKAAACFELFLKTAEPADPRIINTIKARIEELRQ